jgi:hypothetical protein
LAASFNFRQRFIRKHGEKSYWGTVAWTFGWNFSWLMMGFTFQNSLPYDTGMVTLRTETSMVELHLHYHQFTIWNYLGEGVASAANASIGRQV